MSMKIEFDQDTLRPFVQLAVAEALERMDEGSGPRLGLPKRLLQDPEPDRIIEAEPAPVRGRDRLLTTTQTCNGGSHHGSG